MTENKARKKAIRERMAKTGEPYSVARRRLAEQATESAPERTPVPLQDDLADPTGEDIAAYARLLLERLRTRRPEAARPDCRHPWEFTRAIDAAMAAGLDLVDQVTAGNVGPQAVKRATHLAEQVQTAQRATVNALNFNMVHDVAAAYLLVRGTRAVQQGRCLLGQAAPTDCSPDPGRVRLRIHDAFGHEDTDSGCLQHAAEEWTRWDHGGEVTLEAIGPATLAAAVAELGEQLRAERTRADDTSTGTVTLYGTDLGDSIEDQDLINNGLWNREGTYGQPDAALCEEENWDYVAVMNAWCAHAAAQLARDGIVWDRNTDKVTLPATLPVSEAALTWQRVLDGFDAWITRVVDEVRDGVGRAEPDDIRPDDAPGARWITYSTA
ncbi:hypothetical protein GCM10023191_102100 [Actinoallomurus oryzae]|uniref:Uncharacterized protein n=1 Tax=Actinoallomurus oryzae TaxID=502180 RepID=A0ABP8R9H8_9ACTN